MTNPRGWRLALAAVIAAAGPAWAAGATGSPGANGSAPGAGPDSPGTLGTEVPPSSRAALFAYNVQPRVGNALRDGLARLHARVQGTAQEAQVAAQSASDAGVKQIADRIASDAEREDEALVTLAQGNKIALDGKAYREERSRAQRSLSSAQGKSGAAFDEGFLSDMESAGRDNAKDATTVANEARIEGRTDLADYLDGTTAASSARLAAVRQQVRSTASTATGSGG